MTRLIRQYFPALILTTLIVVYLVILAGSVVRASGSGMGCPDWPKCFGHLIPPTDESQVLFQPSSHYFAGEMIIQDGALWSANSDFTAGPAFFSAQWTRYTRHTYAKFKTEQSWTEFINRLLGALSGFCTMVILALSFLFWRQDKLTPFLLLFGTALLAFVGWMGKVVVDNNLQPLMISAHMGSALVMVALLVCVYIRARRLAGTFAGSPVPPLVKGLIVMAIVATLVQISLGLVVRQEIDTISKAMDELHRDTWMGQLDGFFTIHIVSAWMVVLINAALFWKARRAVTGGTRTLLLAALALPGIAYGAGVLMKQLGLPAPLQPVHQLAATMLFGVQCALLVRTQRV